MEELDWELLNRSVHDTVMAAPPFVVVLLLRSLPFIIFHRLLSRFLC